MSKDNKIIKELYGRIFVFQKLIIGREIGTKLSHTVVSAATGLWKSHFCVADNAQGLSAGGIACLSARKTPIVKIKPLIIKCDF